MSWALINILKTSRILICALTVLAALMTTTQDARSAGGDGRVLLNEKHVAIGENGEVKEIWRRLIRIGPNANDAAREIRIGWIPGYEQVEWIRTALVKQKGKEWTVERDLTPKYRKMLENDENEDNDPGQKERVFFLPAERGAVYEVTIGRTRIFKEFGRNYWTSFEFTQPVEVDKALFEVKAPEGSPLFFSAQGFDAKPTVEKADGKQIYSWEYKNYSGKAKAAGKPTAYVMVSSTQDWTTVAKVFSRAFDVAAESSSGIRKTVYGVKDNVPYNGQRVEKLAEYVRASIRSKIERGRAAPFTPRTAGDTISSGAGDCKDQAVLLVAMLRIAEIEAYPALLRLGDTSEFSKQLPNPFYFNHAVVYVPAQRDIERDLWLDTTSSSNIKLYSIPDDLKGSEALILNSKHPEFKKIPDG